MKKSIIKRRKRVVPAMTGPQAGEGGEVMVLDSTEYDRASPPQETERGSVNPDGSMNLGFRPRNSERRTLPDPSSMRSQNSPSSSQPAYFPNALAGSVRDPLDSLNNNNRLPPMTSYPSPAHNRPSLSPNSFLSPSRKRSFASVEQQQPPLPRINSPNTQSGYAGTQNSGRLSDIKSILNPTGHSETEPSSGRQSPYHAQGSALTVNYPARPDVRDGPRDTDQAKVDRRELLQREAERMRRELQAKERELEELGRGD
jgi:hypothetical protein